MSLRVRSAWRSGAVLVQVYELNPKHRMNTRIENQMLCVAVDNNPSKGTFYTAPGLQDAATVFTGSRFMPRFSLACSAAHMRDGWPGHAPSRWCGPDLVPISVDLQRPASPSVLAGSTDHVAMPRHFAGNVRRRRSHI